VADQQTFTAAQLADPEFFQANRSAIFRALQEGRITPGTAYHIGGGQALTDAVAGALDGVLASTPAAPEEHPGNPAKATSAEHVDLAANLRRAFGLD
jgi:hypothetical protein